MNRYTHFVYHVIRSAARSVGVTLSDDDMADLHNDLFLRLLDDDCRRLRQFKGESAISFRAWLRVVTVNVVLGHLRRSRRFVSLTPPDDDTPGEVIEPVGSEPSPLESMEDNELRRVLPKLLEQLQPREKVFLELAYIRELPVPEICSLMGLKPGALYTMKNRMLGKLEAFAREREII